MPFKNQVFRKLDIISANGQEILIDPGNFNPQITFYSQDKTNTAFINAPNFTAVNRVALGMNSGAYTYVPDGINRRIRCFLDDSTGFGRFDQIKTSNSQREGGFALIGPVNGFFGWHSDTSGTEQVIRTDTNGFALLTDSASTWDFSSAKVKTKGRIISPLQDTSYSQGPSPANTLAVATFTDIQNAAGGTFQHNYNKEYSATETDLEVTVNMSLFLTTAASGFSIQVKDTTSGLTQHIVTTLMNTLSDHKFLSITRRFPGLGLAGNLPLTVQWSRVSGGTLNRDQNDVINVVTREVPV